MISNYYATLVNRVASASIQIPFYPDRRYRQVLVQDASSVLQV